MAGIYIALAVGVLPAASFCAVTSCGDHLSAFALLPLDSYERNTDQPSLMLSSSSSSSSSISSSPSSSSNTDVPSSALLEIALIPQAPFGNWNPPFDEACEEASLRMAYTYVRNDPLTLREAEAEIIAMTDWQQQNGYAVDVSVSELSRIAREHYGLEATVYTGDDVTKSFIKNMVASGSPVIVPVAGQMLGNPYFR